MRSILSSFAAVLLLFLGMPLASAQPIQRTGTLLYSNIAPGELNDDLVKHMPVKIMMESETKIPYGGVFVRIFNASGIAVFKEMCEKPWLFVRLPEGDYNVVGVDRNKVTRLKPFHVKKQPEDGYAQTVVTLTWPKSVVGY